MSTMWIVTFGNHNFRRFYTQYHAEQFVRALELNGTSCRIQVLS